MANKFLLIKPKNEQTIETIKSFSIIAQKQLAEYDFTATELAEFINNGNTLNNFVVICYEIPDNINLEENDFHDILINNSLEVHIQRNDIGYSVDLYNSADTYITGCTALNDDLL